METGTLTRRGAINTLIENIQYDGSIDNSLTKSIFRQFRPISGFYEEVNLGHVVSSLHDRFAKVVINGVTAIPHEHIYERSISEVDLLNHPMILGQDIAKAFEECWDERIAEAITDYIPPPHNMYGGNLIGNIRKAQEALTYHGVGYGGLLCSVPIHDELFAVCGMEFAPVRTLPHWDDLFDPHEVLVRAFTHNIGHCTSDNAETEIRPGSDSYLNRVILKQKRTYTFNPNYIYMAGGSI